MEHQFDNVGSEGNAAPSHSPAPWDVSDSLMVTDANADECAMPCGRTDAIVEANARLIAAAPDLLAAAELACTVLANAPASKMPKGTADALRALHAAIARAKGE